MRVLLDHPNPFLLAHGGMQIQIEQTCGAIRSAGVDVEFLRWWDASQQADVIHYVGRPSLNYIAAAQKKNIRIVMAQILTGLGSRSPIAIRGEKVVISAGLRLLPWIVSARFAWDAFKMSDACIANTEWEAHLMRYVFNAPPEKVHVVPNGVEDVFLRSLPVPRGKWLVTSGVITERKRMVEVAEAAVLAQTPLWIVGEPYAQADPYYMQFKKVVADNPRMLRYEGGIRDRAVLARAYREARGFVLLSTKETRSLASEEAAACECPLLLSDLPWARSVFKNHASYCPVTPNTRQTAERMKEFYHAAPGLRPPPKPMGWAEVGRKFREVYERVCETRKSV